MPSPTHVHVYVWSIVYICKYCVCPNGPYGLLDFEIKLYGILVCITQLFHGKLKVKSANVRCPFLQ